jgi:hypothetical protein
LRPANSLGAPEPGFPAQAFAFEKGVLNMLWAIFVILLVLWLLGFTLHIAGGLIHILLVIALIILVINLVTGRRAV